MSDRRETILAALFTALQTVTSDGGDAITATERNPTVELDESIRPALRMFDGDEIRGDKAGRPANRKPPQFCRMQPAIYGYVADDATDIAASVNDLVARVRKATFGNAAFLKALGSEDTLTQDSLVVQYDKGATAEGRFGLHFDLEYSFNPDSP